MFLHHDHTTARDDEVEDLKEEIKELKADRLLLWGLVLVLTINIILLA